MHFLSVDSLRAAVAAMPQVIDHLVTTSNVVFVLLGVVGIALLIVRDRWFGRLLLGARARQRLLLRELPRRPVALPAADVAHPGDRPGDHGRLVRQPGRALARGTGVRSSQYAVLVLPVVLLASNWTVHDQSDNRDGEAMTEQIFAALPPNAVLVTYWDALTPLSYKHCIEGVRPDVSLRAYDTWALVTCDRVDAPLDEVAKERPVLRAAGPGRRPRRGHRADARAGRPGSSCRGASAIRSSTRPLYRLVPARTPRDAWRPATSCSTSAAGPGSSGSGTRRRPTGRSRRRWAPAATPTPWRAADLRFERDRGWSGPRRRREPWPIEIDGLTLELRATEAGQVGLFPEHAAMLPWLRRAGRGARSRTAARRARRPAPVRLHGPRDARHGRGRRRGHPRRRVAADRRAGRAATPTASGLADRPVRWIVDDAVAFAEREVRRGRRYAGVVLDPPSYGHGPGRGAWRIERRPGRSSPSMRAAPRAGRLRAADRPHGGARRGSAGRRARRRARPAPGARHRDAATSSSSTPTAGAGWSSAPSRGRRAGHDDGDALPCPAAPDQRREPADQGGRRPCATGASATGPA